MVAVLCLILGLVVGAAGAFIAMLLCWPQKQDIIDAVKERTPQVKPIGIVDSPGGRPITVYSEAGEDYYPSSVTRVFVAL